MAHDLRRVWEDQWKAKAGRHLTYDEFFELTPHAIFRMYFREPPSRPPETDEIALLRRINQHRASQGLPPATPPWFLKEVPRHG